IVANRVVRNESIELGAGRSASSDFSIAFTALAEPKLRMLRAGYAARIDQATDDNGNSLVPDEVAAQDRLRRAGFTAASGGAWTFQGRLAYPPHNPGKRIVSIKGAIDVVLQTRFQ